MARGRGRGRGCGRQGAGQGRAVPPPEVQSSVGVEASMEGSEEEVASAVQVGQVPPATPAAAPLAAPAAVPVVGAMGLHQWNALRLDTFDGLGTPVDAANWLRHMERHFGALGMTSEMRAQFVAFQLKGQADIWWEGVLTARTAAHGPVTWELFVEQFRRRFYPASFVERMEVSLNSYKQGKLSVSEYEAGFNNIIRFVPAVATNEAEKAKRFRRGLRQEFRKVLGALELRDFSSLVEQARGMELEMQLGEDMQGMGGTVVPSDAGGSQKRSFGGGSGSFLKPVSKKFKGS